MTQDRPTEDLLDELLLLPNDERSSYLARLQNEDPKLSEKLQKLLVAAEKAGTFLDLDEDTSGCEVPNHVGPYCIREKIGEGGMGIVYVAEQAEPVQRKVALKIIKPGMDTKEVIARFEAERQALAFMEHPNIARVLDAGSTDSRGSLRDPRAQDANSAESQTEADSNAGAKIGGAISDFGRPYFVMELVRGIPITEYCDQVKATTRERLKLFQTVCDAVQHAHQKGIIHRDIKPSNVLVTQVSAKPVVKVIDFGLAKAVSGQRLTEKTLYTGFMKLMGTPAYMSPEQTGLSGLDVDTRSDIYSLGVLLYELLTGTTPLDKTEIQKQAYDELYRQIREVDAPKPSTRFSTLKDAERSTVAEQRQIEPRELRQLLDGDLDRVVLKAIEKDRDRRYGSPQDFAADIDRFLDDQPVLAVAPSTSYLARKYMRRHKVAILTAATVLSLLIAVSAISTWQAIQVSKANETATSERNAATRAKQEAVAEKEKAEKSQDAAIASEERAQQLADERRQLLYASNMQLADQIWNRPSGTVAEIQELLVNWIPVGEERDLREFSWRYQWSRLHDQAKQALHDVRDVAFSPTGDFLVADATGIQQWDSSNNVFEQRWSQRDVIAASTTLSPCGRWAAISDNGRISLIEIATGSVMHETSGGRVTFSVDGEYALLRVQGEEFHPTGALFHLSSGEQRPLPTEVNEYAVTPHEIGGKFNQTVLRSIGPNAESFLLRERGFLTWFAAGRSAPRTWHFISYVNTTAIAPNGTLFANGQSHGEVQLRLARAPDRFVVLPAPGLDITAVAFSRDSKCIAVGGSGGIVNLWDIGALSEWSQASDPMTDELASPKLIRSIRAHRSSIYGLSVSNGGHRLATRAAGGEAKLWEFRDMPNLNKMTLRAEDVFGARVGVQFETIDDGVFVSSVNPEWHELVSGEIRQSDQVVAVTNGSTRQEIKPSMDHVDLGYLMRGPRDSLVTLQLRARGAAETRLAKLRRRHIDVPLATDITFLRNGRSLAVSDSMLGAVLFSLDGPAVRRLPYCGSSVVASPSGRFLAFDDCRHLVLWDLDANQLHARWESRAPTMQFRADMGTICFSPDEKYLAMGTGLRFNHVPKRSDLKVWEVHSRKEIGGGPLLSEDVGINGVVFSPDGKSLLAATESGLIRVIETTTWKQEREIQAPFGKTRALAISPDGKTVALGGRAGTVIFDFASGSRRHVLRIVRPQSLEFSPDGRTLAAMGLKFELVDVATGMQVCQLFGHPTFALSATFSPDGGTLATLDHEGNVRMWKAPSLEQIDRSPITNALLYERGVKLNQNEQFSAAEDVLRRVLDRQQETLAADSADLKRTQEQLSISLAGQQEVLNVSEQSLRSPDKPPPDATRR